MTKAKKAQAAAEILPPDAPPVEEKAKPVMATETHTVVRRYNKRVAVEPEKAEAPEDEDEEIFLEEDEEEEPLPEEPLDPIAALLSEIGANEANYSMIVYRIRNYERDQSLNPKTRIRVGVLSIPDAQYLADLRHEEEIQFNWARPGLSNYFQCQIRRNGKLMVFLPNVIQVEPLAAKERAEKATEITPAFAYPEHAPEKSELKQFTKTLRELREAGLVSLAGLSAPAAAPVSSEMSDELAMLRLIKADDETRQKLFSGVRGLMNGGEKQTGLMDLIMLALQNGPELIRAAAEVWKSAEPSPLLAPTPPAFAQMPPRPAPMPPPPPAPNPAQELFNYGLQALERRAPVSIVSSYVNQKADQDEQLNQLVETFLAATPQDCLDWLVAQVPQSEPIANAPGASDWIADLQAALSRPQESEAVN